MKVYEINTDLQKDSSFQFGAVLDESASSLTRGWGGGGCEQPGQRFQY